MAEPAVDDNEEDIQQQQHMIEEEVASENESFDLQTEEVEMPGVVVINQHGNNNDVDAPSKGIYLEPVSDGQTYVLTLNGTESLQTSRMHFDTSKIQVLQTSIPEIVQQGHDGDFNQAWFTSREDKTILHRKGQLWKQGMWSKEETDILQNNIISYCKERGIVDPAEIIFEMTKDERKDFYRIIAKGLNRPLFSVYRRVIRMYDTKNHVGKYTPQEIDKLKDLRTKHGNDWQAIGAALGRSASSIKDRCRLMKDNCNTGKWLPVEEKRLTDAVYQQSRTIPGEAVTSGISWATVAEAVGTRSEKQCRTKWLNYLNWKQIGGTEWTREDDINLICKVYSLNVTDENSIDWIELSRGWHSVRSPQWLRGKWWNLKRHVADAHLLSFRNVCEYLYNNHAQIVHVKVSNDEVSSTSVLESVASTPLTIPQVSVVQAPSIVTTVPIQMKTDVPTSIGQSITHSEDDVCSVAAPVGATFQTYEVLPSTMHLNAAATSAPFLIATPTQTIPFTTCTTNSAGQIIIQTLPAETLQTTDVTVHMNMSSQIIISTAGALGHVTTPVQLTRPMHHLLTAQGTLLTSGEELLTSENVDKEQEGLENEMDKQEVESSEDLIPSDSQLILADPMLSTDTGTEFVDQECEKT
uniref:Cyclin-D-binding Myb-like transcription factor 1 n=1 Tax=Strigamia maritima TaxID=126957 RepID=T1IZJ1_STRMM